MTSWIVSPPGSSVHGDSTGKNTGVGCQCLPPGDIPNPGIEPRFPTLLADSLHKSFLGFFFFPFGSIMCHWSLETRVSFEVSDCRLCSFQACFAIVCLLRIVAWTNLSVSLRNECHWDFTSDYFESVDHFG